MEYKVEDYYWHDSTILNIQIPQGLPRIDEVIFTIDWYDGGIEKVIFYGCREVNMNLKFGLNNTDEISSVNLIIENDGLNEIKNKWKKIGVQLNDLVCYHIKSYNDIYIYCKGFRVDPL